MAVLWSAPALAGTIVVNSTADDDDVSPGNGVCETDWGNGVCTLRAAVTESNHAYLDDTILVPAATYVLSTGLPELVSPVHIVGDGADVVVIDGDGTDTVFRVSRHIAARFEGLTITGGYTTGWGGGAYIEGQASFVDCVITGNSAELGGGGIHISQVGQAVGFAYIERTEISYNDTAGSGGGIQVLDGFDFEALFLYHSTVLGNTSASGGAGVSHDRGIPGTSVMPRLQANANSWGPGDSISAEGVTASSWCIDATCTATASTLGESDLEVTIVDEYDPLTGRERGIQYIQITNHGPDDATNVRFWVRPPDGVDYDVANCSTERLGDLFCQAFNIPAGQTFTFEGEVRHDGLVGTYDTEVFAVGNQGDVDTGDDTWTEPITVIPAPLVDLGISATGPTEAFAGQPLAFDITVDNSGPDSMFVPGTGLETARGGIVQVFPILIVGGLPVAATFLSASSSGGDCTIQILDLGGGRIFERAECLFDDLEPGESATFDVVVVAGDAGTLSTQFSSGAIHVADPGPSPNALTLDVAILDSPCANPTLVGTDGDDVLFGTNGADVIDAGAGNDLVIGLGGDDLICAGDGNDLVLAGPGADIVFGDAGDDAVFGGLGDDTLDGGTGADLVLGGRGVDTCPVGEGDLVVCEQ